MGAFRMVDTGVGTYAVALSGRDGAQSMSSFFDLSGRSWDKDPQTVGEVAVVPWGPDNEMPRMVRDKITKQIADVMAGKKNAGKFFTCVDFVDDQGHTQEWKIEPIELNLDKYIQAQKDISRLADSATTSAMGLSPALSNIIIDGKSDSGSQMLYALRRRTT